MKQLSRFIIFLYLFLLSGGLFATPIEVISMKTVFSTVAEKIQEYGAKKVLLVFDIDNTLLTANQDFSSYAWSSWQQKLIKNNRPNAITNDLNKFYKIENVLYTLGSMHPPEKIIPLAIKKIQNLGTTVLALTSRGPAMRSATERELLKNNILLDSKNFHAGFPGQYIPQRGKGRSVSFQRGIYMTAGQNKGEMLRDLLLKTNQQYKVIIFVDDLRKHVEHMHDVFKSLGENIITFRYGKMDRDVLRFQLSDKRAVMHKWQQLLSVWKELFL